MVHRSIFRFKIILAFLISFSVAKKEVHGQADTQWIWLFDGTSVEHWKGIDCDHFPTRGWVVNDGALVVNPGGKGSHGGSIVTREKYENFDLEFEFKFAEGANGGIKYQLKEYPSGAWLGCEYQIVDDENNRDIANDENGLRLTASLYELFEPQEKVLHPAGSWNTGKIRLMGRRVEHWLNGKVVLSYERGDPDFLRAKAQSKFRSIADFGVIEQGRIMLQDHGDEIAFRKIRIRPTNHLYASHSQSEIYHDKPFLQDYAIKYESDGNQVLRSISIDRNDRFSILSNIGLLQPISGQFQFPGQLRRDELYAYQSKTTINAVTTLDGQYVYLTDSTIFSNAWAGKLFIRHDMSDAKHICAADDGSLVISDGTMLSLIDGEGEVMTSVQLSAELRDMVYDQMKAEFWILTKTSLAKISRSDPMLSTVVSGKDFTAMAWHQDTLVIGQADGFVQLDLDPGTASSFELGPKNIRLPHTQITTVTSIGGHLWFGSTKGAFMRRDDGTYNYYHGKRWLVDNHVIDLAGSSSGDVAILTKSGLSVIKFEKMTLEDKATLYEKQVRDRHIRYGLYSDQARMTDGKLSTAQVSTQASDNLWSGMYLVSQLFRYMVTGEEPARRNCIETFEAMDRLHTINGIPGLFGRSYERKGIKDYKPSYRKYAEDYWYPDYATSVAWHPANDEWDWEGTASSDQTVGQVFALTMMAEFFPDEEIRDRAIELLDQLMGYILAHNFQLIDVDGRPTLWGRWNPAFINRFDTMIGDRRLGSSNIVAFLQSTYHFTGKEKYKSAALDLLYNHGYLENLTRPIKEIGRAPEHADKWSKMLSRSWNHSDDEMYFLAYWSLYHHALDDQLREAYYKAIQDHWEWERPEKDALWNFCYAAIGAQSFDLAESVWHLCEFPLDMIQFEVENSHRKDLKFVPNNFRGQTITKVLPPDERPELKHNRNLFTLDAADRHAELGAGDTFLLPYWMGRFLGVISAPQKD